MGPGPSSSQTRSAHAFRDRRGGRRGRGRSGADGRRTRRLAIAMRGHGRGGRNGPARAPVRGLRTRPPTPTRGTGPGGRTLAAAGWRRRFEQRPRDQGSVRSRRPRSRLAIEAPRPRASSSLALQRAFEIATGREEARLHGPGGDAKRFCDRGDGATLEVVEDEDRARIHRQGPKGPIEGVAIGNLGRPGCRRSER